jgi:RNA polymerase sigma-70 factor, ECF subfamily
LTENSFKPLDKPEFELLFRAHFKGMVYYAQQYIKDLDSAREIAQEAFIALWEKRDQIDMSRSVKSYLSSSIHNKCMNVLREQKKFDRSLLAFEGLSETAADASFATDHRETEVLINAAIEELPEKCREIFRLSRFEHLKYQQIADQLGISVKTVEAHMSKALQHMRARLADHLPGLLLLCLYHLN